jgi:NAD(P)-dependent dehydrogenase (short-subunit alcohol dehydrogenase family)
MAFDFSDRVAIVTGAGSGIGAAVARRLAADGARVIVSGLASDPIEDVAQAIRDAGGTALALAADVARFEDVSAAVDRAVAEFGRLDQAVNCAGVAPRLVPLAETAIDEWQRVTSINLSGVFHALRAEIPVMLSGGGGAIVNIASIQATLPLVNGSPYSAAKCGVVGLTRNAAIENADKGVRVNAVSPGITDTPMVASEPEVSAQVVAYVPMGRIARPDEMASAVAFLLSDEAAYITGSELIVDGGLTLR